MTAASLLELEAKHRRRILLRAIIRVTATTTMLVVLYYSLPFDGLDRSAALFLALGIVGFTAALWWQVRSIRGADFPALRAVESLGVTIPLVIIVFAVTYLKMSTANSANFSEVLDHTDALYFTTTVLATVGFGDITPTTQAARLVVTFQMVLDLVLIATIARLLFGTAQKSIERRQTVATDEPSGDEPLA